MTLLELFYKRIRHLAFLYFGLIFGSSMLMILCEIAEAYWPVNEIPVAAGNRYTNAEVAEILHIAAHTVKNHLYSTYRKLNVWNRVELVNVIDSIRDSSPEE